MAVITIAAFGSEGAANVRAFIASSIIALAIVSALNDNGASTAYMLTGTVVAFRAGESITLANDTTDPEGVQIALREETVHEGDELHPALIGSDVRATVWDRMTGERRPVADQVRVASRRPTRD